MGSIPPAESIEFPQREIVNFITDARLTPDNVDLHQLGKAVQSNGVVYCDDQGTLNQLAITVNPQPAQLVKGMTFIVKSPISNTGPATLKVNSLAPVPIVRSTDQALLQLGDISPNALLAYGYDGANFQMVWTQRQPGAPIYLTAPRTYYVNGTSGDDNYDGQAATVGAGHGPYKTIQAACNQIPLYNMNNFNITINVADGSYAAFSIPRMNGSGVILINGNNSNPAACSVLGTNISAINCSAQGAVKIAGFKVANSGPGGPGEAMAGINMQGGGTACSLDAMEFGTCTGMHILIQFGAIVSNTNPHSPWKISGSAKGFLSAENSSQFVTHAGGGPDFNIAVPVTFSSAFVGAAFTSTTILTFGALTGAGNVTGTRYNAVANSSIIVNGGGLNYYPGTIPGTLSLGGQYG